MGVTNSLWAFDGTVPGPMVCVMEGDTAELAPINQASSVVSDWNATGGRIPCYATWRASAHEASPKNTAVNAASTTRSKTPRSGSPPAIAACSASTA